MPASLQRQDSHIFPRVKSQTGVFPGCAGALYVEMSVNGEIGGPDFLDDKILSQRR